MKLKSAFVILFGFAVFAANPAQANLLISNNGNSLALFEDDGRLIRVFATDLVSPAGRVSIRPRWSMWGMLVAVWEPPGELPEPLPSFTTSVLQVVTCRTRRRRRRLLAYLSEPQCWPLPRIAAGNMGDECPSPQTEKRHRIIP